MAYPCKLSCAVSVVFIVAMIYMMYATNQSNIIGDYEKTLSKELAPIYKKIAQERTSIYYYGYFLGFILALLFIIYNSKVKKVPLSSMPLVCIVVSISFFTNYFYYILSPKTTYMTEHLKTQEEIKAWGKMYRGMQKYYHTGLVLGLIAIGALAFAFRC
jgi:1,4-dihydroxy-2-naphthoate octaprenyltransferase